MTDRILSMICTHFWWSNDPYDEVFQANGGSKHWISEGREVDSVRIDDLLNYEGARAHC